MASNALKTLRERNFNVEEQVSAMVESDKPFPILIANLDSTKEVITEELQSVVFHNYRRFIAVSDEVSNVTKDVLKMKTAVQRMKGVVTAISKESYVDYSGKASTLALPTNAHAMHTSHGVGTGMENTGLDVASLSRVPKKEVGGLVAMSEEIDQLISLRQFEAATESVLKARSKFKSAASDMQLLRVEDKVAQAIREELARLPHSYLHPTLLNLLTRLGRTRDASDFFLSTQTRWIQREMNKVKFIGDGLEYARCATKLVVVCVQHVVKQHEHLFQGVESSSIVGWVASQVKHVAAYIQLNLCQSEKFEVIMDIVVSCEETVNELDALGMGVKSVFAESLIPALMSAAGAHAQQISASIATYVETDEMEIEAVEVYHAHMFPEHGNIQMVTRSCNQLFKDLCALVDLAAQFSRPSFAEAFDAVAQEVCRCYLQTFETRLMTDYSIAVSIENSAAALANVHFILFTLIPAVVSRLSTVFHTAYCHHMTSLQGKVSVFLVTVQAKLFGEERAAEAVHAVVPPKPGKGKGASFVHDSTSVALFVGDMIGNTQDVLDIVGAMSNESVAMAAGQSMALSVLRIVSDAVFWELHVPKKELAVRTSVESVLVACATLKLVFSPLLASGNGDGAKAADEVLRSFKRSAMANLGDTVPIDDGKVNRLAEQSLSVARPSRDGEKLGDALSAFKQLVKAAKLK